MNPADSKMNHVDVHAIFEIITVNAAVQFTVSRRKVTYSRLPGGSTVADLKSRILTDFHDYRARFESVEIYHTMTNAITNTAPVGGSTFLSDVPFVRVKLDRWYN